MINIVKLEITDLHSFFQRWFNGKVPCSNLIFQRLTDVLHPKFILISPNGQKRHRREIIQEIWDGYGSRDSENDPMKLWIENYEYRGKFDSIYLATYEEWQSNNTEMRGRLSTVIFKKVSNNYNNLRWLHVHET